jgi:hypothetical protein
MVTDLLQKRQMYLKFIDRNTQMKIRMKTDSEDGGAEYRALFYDLDTDLTFFARSEEIYALAGDAEGSLVNVTFWLRENMYTFEGKLIGAASHMGEHMVLIEQMSLIAATSRRSDTRNEMRIHVNLYEMTQKDMELEKPRIPESGPIYMAETFDVSAGGFCLVSNEPLMSDGPLFLAEFSLSDKSEFLLPVRLLRKGNCPQTVLYHYDYGFLFVFDRIPGEKARVATAITDAVFRSRLAAHTR